jgi:hypothetical protein
MKHFISALRERRQIEWGTLSGTRIDELLLWCSKYDDGGVNERPGWRDWTDQDTTPDQQRIEDILARGEIRGKVLLHVGVGNSSLAKRFCGAARAIDGITIQGNECRHARGLRISNYRVVVANKYDSRLSRTLGRTYDLIVDNNPTTFCCCRRHLATMLASYADLLKPNGILVTDKEGLRWTPAPNDPRWGLTVTEWFTMAARFGLTGMRYSDSVVGVRKGSAWRSALHNVRLVTRTALPHRSGHV